MKCILTIKVIYSFRMLQNLLSDYVTFLGFLKQSMDLKNCYTNRHDILTEPCTCAVNIAVDYTIVYWESSAEENIHDFHRFWALANVFLLLFSIDFV